MLRAKKEVEELRESIVEGLRAGREGKSGDTGESSFQTENSTSEQVRKDCRACAGSGENFAAMVPSFGLT